MPLLAAVRPRQAGFALVELSIAAILVLLGAIWFANRIQNDVQDAGARATAAYLLAVRGATQEMLVQHFETLAGYPAMPAHAGPPPPVPSYLEHTPPLDLGVAELVTPRGAGLPGYLPAGFPTQPVYGGEVRVAHEVPGRSTSEILKRAGRE